jgi:hypothetical protein
MSSKKAKAQIKDPWSVVEETLNRAFRRAWERRLYKHVECPISSESEIERIRDTVVDEMCSQLMEVVSFGEDQ